MSVRAEALSEASRESADAATEAALRINWTNTRAPRVQPRSSKPGTPGPVATSRSRSSAFRPAMLAGGLKRRMLNKRGNTAGAGANAAMGTNERPRWPNPENHSNPTQNPADVGKQTAAGLAGAKPVP